MTPPVTWHPKLGSSRMAQSKGVVGDLHVSMATMPPSQSPRITSHILPLSPVVYATLPRGKIVRMEALCGTLLPYFCLCFYSSRPYFVLLKHLSKLPAHLEDCLLSLGSMSADW